MDLWLIKGHIIGINEVGIGSLGGAIPSNLAKKIAEELVSNGFISRSWSGLECQPIFEKGKEGIMVAGVIQDSPADKSGFRPGDRITHYNGKSVNAQIPEDLPLFQPNGLLSKNLEKKLQSKDIEMMRKSPGSSHHSFVNLPFQKRKN